MVYLTKDELIKKKRRIRARFRKLVRRAVVNSIWVFDLEEKKLSSDVKGNVALVLRKVKANNSLITIVEKRIINTPVEKRKPEDRKWLEDAFRKMSCFETLPVDVVSKLVDVVEFRCHEKRKTILKEGHLANFMYFILFGEVIVSKRVLTPDNENEEEILKILRSGDMFGDIALFNNARREATYTTETACEFLVVNKLNFEKILKETLAKQREQIRLAVQRFEYFKNFSESKITECCLLSRIVEYRPQEIIFSQDDIANFSFFVLSGQCMILQCLKMKLTPDGKYKLIEEQRKTIVIGDIAIPKVSDRMRRFSMVETDEVDKANLKCQFIDVGTISCGGVFGIGEEILNRTIIAKTTVQCLLVPRHWLFQKSQNIGNVWQRMKIFLNSSIPSQDKLFNDFLNNLKWKRYKKKVINQILAVSKQNINDTQPYNIPVICRIEEGNIAKFK